MAILAGVNASLSPPTIQRVEPAKTPARAFRTGGSPITKCNAAKSPVSNRPDAPNHSPFPPIIDKSFPIQNPPSQNNTDKPKEQTAPEKKVLIGEKPNENSILDKSTTEIECEVLDTMDTQNEKLITEKPVSQNSILDESTTDIECEVLDTMDVSFTDPEPVPELPTVEFESVADLIKDFEDELELDEDLRFHLFTKTFKRIISTNEKDLIDSPTYNLYYEKLAKQVKPYMDRLDSIANFARDISAEILSISGKIKVLKSNIISTENKKSVRESLRQIEFPHFGDILKVIRDQKTSDSLSELDVFAHLEDYDCFLFDINQLYTRVGLICEEIKR